MSSAPNYFPPPSGPLANLTRSVATLRLDPATLAERLGLRFLPGFDDLDSLDWAEVIGRLGRYALVCHRNAPNPSTELVISSESRNPRLELTDALDALRLTEKDVSWMHPDVASERRRQRAFVKAKRRVAARAVSTKRLQRFKRSAKPAERAPTVHARSRARTASARSNRSTRKK
jgi:hypothetical protein